MGGYPRSIPGKGKDLNPVAESPIELWSSNVGGKVTNELFYESCLIVEVISEAGSENSGYNYSPEYHVVRVIS